MLTLAATGLAASEAVRKQRHLSLLGSAEDGSPISRISNAVYGFSYAPGEKVIPLLHKSASTAFELHKRQDSKAFLLGGGRMPPRLCPVGAKCD